MKKRNMIRSLLFTMAWSLWVAVLPVALATAADVQATIEKPVAESIRIRAGAQKADETWREEKQVLITRLEALEQEIRQLETEKQALEQEVDATNKRIQNHQDQLADMKAISSRLTPFLESTVDRLESDLKTGLPFLEAERTQRLEKLRGLLSDSEQAVSEKLRKVLEALMVEAEYGFTIEAYMDTIPVEGQNRFVTVFRLGRLNLFYQTPDGRECGFYNIAERRWQSIDRKYHPAIAAAVEMAMKRRPMDFVDLPLGELVKP